MQADVADAESVDGAFSEIEDALRPGRAAREQRRHHRATACSMRMSDEHWDDVLGTNLTGAFHTIRRATPKMMRGRFGRIVNVSSVSGQTGQAGPGQLLGGQGRAVGPHPGGRPGARVPRHHLQRGRPRAYRDRHDRRAARRLARRGPSDGAARAPRDPRGGARPSSPSSAPTPPATSPARSFPSTAASAWGTERRDPRSARTRRRTTDLSTTGGTDGT